MTRTTDVSQALDALTPEAARLAEFVATPSGRVADELDADTLDERVNVETIYAAIIAYSAVSRHTAGQNRAA